MQIRKRNFFIDPIKSPTADLPPPDVTSFGLVQPEFDSYTAIVADLTHQIQVHGTI